jgi:hypothetical protein
MSTFVGLSGGMRLFQIDTEIAPVTITPDTPFTPAATDVASGNLSVASTECGCLSLFQIFVPFGGALVTENSSLNPNAVAFYPIITEDGLYYIITENSTMADPIKISELTEGNLATIIANSDNVEMMLSYSGESYKFNFGDLISFMKSYILTSKHEVTLAGATGQSNSLINRQILDAELNEQNIAVLPAIPVLGEQGLYVNSVTGDYELYNMGDPAGLNLKIIYSNT